MPSRKKDRGKQRKAKQKCDEEAARKAEAGRGLDDLLTPGGAQTLRELKANGFFIDRGPDGSIRMHHPSMVRPDASFEEFTNRVRGLRPDGDFEELINNREALNDTERQQLAFNYVHSYAEELRKGSYEAASLIVSNLSDHHLGPHLRDELLKSAVHLSVLSFLSQCDRPMSDVLPSGCGEGGGSNSIITMPALWLDILRQIVLEGCSDDALLEVAQGIRSFVEGIADEKRELFRSNTIWSMCLQPFFDLVHCIMKQSRRGFSEMLSYEGLLPFVAQASCWSVSRPDIVAEARALQPRDFYYFVCDGAQQVIGAVIDAQDHLEGEGVSLPNPIEQIACTPLLSNDQECLDSTIVGLVDQMCYEHQDLEFLPSSLIYPLLLDKGYVDARVIAAVIDIGRRGSARFATDVMLPILGLDEEYEHIQPIDSRYAAAIRAGLLEVLTRDQVHDESNDEFAADDVYSIAKGIYAMAGHSKTSRALRERKAEILEALGTLRQSRSGLSNTICTVVEDAVDFGTPICCNCLKIFDRNVLRFCQGCNVECYCSAVCQAESWDAGHSRLCGWPKWEGINATEHKRCEVLRQNVMMLGCRIVRQNIGKIQLALKEEKCNAVAVSFTEYPPRFGPLSRAGSQSSGGLECVFTSPVHYGFAAKTGKGGIVLDKVIPQGVVAQLESNLVSEATMNDLEADQK